MNKVAQYYRELVASLTERLKTVNAISTNWWPARSGGLNEAEDLTRDEVRQVTQAVRRDLKSSRSYQESRDEFTDSVFMRVIKESLWQELADITDKTSWSGAKCSRMSATTAFTTAVKWWGWAIWCVSSATTTAFYTPEVLPLCPKCGHDQFQRRPFEP